jgi:hypothetical protein
MINIGKQNKTFIGMEKRNRKTAKQGERKLSNKKNCAQCPKSNKESSRSLIYACIRRYCLFKKSNEALRSQQYQNDKKRCQSQNGLEK